MSKPFSVNQILTEKPNVAKTDIIPLGGNVAGSFNGGRCKVIHFKRVMAGEYHQEYGFKLKIRTLTPLTPPYQNLQATIRAYAVPDIRVWTDAEKFAGQGGGTSVDKVRQIPNMGGKYMPKMTTEDVNICDTSIWRDTFVSSYIPRMGNFTRSEQQIIMPNASILPLRGIVAIYNDMLRNKEYDTEIITYKDNDVSNEEWNSYFLLEEKNLENADFYQLRARKENSYYTNYRTELQGFETEYPPEEMSADTAIINWMKWEQQYAESKGEALNAQKNPWDIIAEIRGSKKLTQGKVIKIGETTFNLNYAAITQSTYNTEAERQEFRSMGTQGGYSYTEIYVPVYKDVMFIEEGYVHFIINVHTDETVFDSGFDRIELNVEIMDTYRPDLVEQKHDVLYKIEMGTKWAGNQPHPNEIVGFKRKFSEYFKLNNNVNGDLTQAGYYQFIQDMNADEPTMINEGEILPNNTYQLFEESAEWHYTPIPSTQNTHYVPKKIWKDYTDLLINKNLAYMEKIITNDDQNEPYVEISGQNQIDYVGKAVCLARLPISEDIRKDFLKWGEH